MKPTETLANVPADAPASSLVCWLDRAIVLLMVAILLTLSWPVCLAFWPKQQSAPPTVTAPQPSGSSSDDDYFFA